MLSTFIANLKHAVQNQETVTIGGGEFTPAEIDQVLKELESLDNKSEK
jgi:hypothetical protein